MRERWQAFTTPIALMLCAFLTTFAVLLHPEYLTSYEKLGALFFLEILAMSLWFYRVWFLPLLLIVFTWSGVGLPMHEVFTVARWAVLGVGAGAGFVVYLKQRRLHFGLLHVVGLLCAVTAAVSSWASAYPSVAALKALSLFLLFLFAATGGRIASAGREAEFMVRLVVATQFLVGATAIAYLVFHYPFFGNPNALGAVMGVAGVPLTLWAVLIAKQPPERFRSSVAFFLALVLLFSSYARAGLVAAAISSMLVCLALRKYASLARGLLLAAVLLIAVNVAVPEQSEDDNQPQPIFAAYLYKGHRDVGLLGSRRSVWDRTVASIRRSPFLGSGFGTSAAESDDTTNLGSFSSTTQVSKEHGNSYLAIVEWVGLLGVAPFLMLIAILMVCSVRVMRFLHRSPNPRLIVVPMMAVIVAGLVHATFEDWLFAPGYYLCVLYWTMAFVFVDAVSATLAAPVIARSLSVD